MRTMRRGNSINRKLRVEAKKLSGETPWGRKDDGTKGRRKIEKGREVQNQERSMSKQGQRGVVSIDFKVFARQC